MENKNHSNKKIPLQDENLLSNINDKDNLLNSINYDLEDFKSLDVINDKNSFLLDNDQFPLPTNHNSNK